MKGLDISLISGCMLGIETTEDEDFNYVFVDLAFLRLSFFWEKA